MFIAGRLWPMMNLSELLSASALGFDHSILITVPLVSRQSFDVKISKVGGFPVQKAKCAKCQTRTLVCSLPLEISNLWQAKAVSVLHYFKLTLVLLGLGMMKVPSLLPRNRGTQSVVPIFTQIRDQKQKNANRY